MKVRCIDNKDAEHYLELNKIYDIDDTPETDYYFGVSKGIGKGSYTEYFRSTRFEIVGDYKTTVNFKFSTVNTIVINGIEYISWYDIPLAVRGTIPTYLYQPVYQLLTDNLANITKENK